MLFENAQAGCNTNDADKITLGGGYRLPAGATTDARKISLGGGYRLPPATADARKITLGGGYRLVG